MQGVDAAHVRRGYACDVRAIGVGGRCTADDEWRGNGGGEQHAGEQATQSSCVRQEVIIPFRWPDAFRRA